ncbi:ABC transporter ATP-binding protein [Bacillus tianshenii]|nr:ABC transporter ATP-binding protein [Bacillus tianshenii]
MEEILKVSNLKISFQNSGENIDIIRDVNFSIKKGEILGLVGESGSGKSVTSMAVMGLLPPNVTKIKSGSILFKENDLLKAPKKELRKIRGNEIAMIFQDPMSTLDPAYKVGYQIEEMLLFHKKESKKGAKERAIELLQLVGIPSPEQRYNEYPHQLSGGMRQRVVIAIALACDPELIIADEPTTALDVTVQAEILDLLQELKEKINTSILLITHDMGVVAEMCDRVLVMYAGQIAEAATVEEIFDKPAHPYTLGLLQSTPKISETKERLYSIEGQVPSPKQMPKGCKFAPRCKFSTEKCQETEPSLEEVMHEHQVKCWHYTKVLAEGEVTTIDQYTS